MQFEKIQLNAPHLTLWLTDDKGLVFHQGQKELSQLEPLSIAMLIALDEGLNQEQAIIELQQHSNLSKEQLKASLEQIKVLFKNTQEQRTYADGLYPELQNHIRQQLQQQSFCVKVANATFAITSDDESLLTQIKALLKPIEIATPNEIDFAFHIEIYKGNYLLVSNDLVVEEGLAQNQVMPVFIDRLQILAYQHSDYCFGFHGAALTKVDYRLRGNDAEICHSRLVQETTSEAEIRHSRLVRETTSEAEIRHSRLVRETTSEAEIRHSRLVRETISEAEIRHSRLVRETTSVASEQTNMDPRLGSGSMLRSTSSIHGVVREEDAEQDREKDNEAAPRSSVTILLPGVSGAGKSTLTAELSKQNFSVYSDEIIALNNTFNLTTLALPMAIKSGSWQHIAKLYPEIDAQPEWHRVDGRILKYIWPEQIAESQNMDPRMREEDVERERDNDNGENRHSFPELDSGSVSGSQETTSKAEIRHSFPAFQPTPQRRPELDSGSRETIETPNKTFLISPSFNKNATPKATKLSVVETIALVTNGGYQLGVELTEDRVEQLIHFCEQINAYQITYGNSEQAQQLVQQLCKK